MFCLVQLTVLVCSLVSYPVKLILYLFVFPLCVLVKKYFLVLSVGEIIFQVYFLVILYFMVRRDISVVTIIVPFFPQDLANLKFEAVAQKVI